MGEGKRQCKVCAQEKVHVFVKVSKSKNYLYADEHGRLWKGKVCPECQAAKRRETYKPKTKDIL